LGEFVKTVKGADLFCGAGGTSSGLVKACLKLKANLELIAVNHWNIAISTHQANHPYAKHLCESVDNVDPRKLVPGGRLNILVASPECTHHSNARGGRPMSDQSRATAWAILRWAEALYIDNIIIENVREFKTWGPLGADGRPLKSKRGHTYNAFLDALRALGYTVEDRILNAANYGDPTTRERLFIMARRGGRKINWPVQTHGSDPLFKKLKPWNAARGIIDWSIPGASIFSRKRPLAPATLARIEAGLKKFGGKNAEPFLVILRNHCSAKSIDEPVPTLAARGQHVALCEPFVLGQQSGATARSVKNPLPTIATGGAISLVEPFLIPFFGERNGQGPRTHSLDEPLPAVTSHGAGGLVEPFLVNAGGPRVSPQSVDQPMNTVLTRDHMALVEPFLTQMDYNGRNRSLDEPMPTITSADAFGIVEPFLVKYNGTAKAQPISEPIDTITSKDRFGLVETAQGTMRIDIRFRMLKPHELAAAMSFDSTYKFSGNREEQVRQIGNAVPVCLGQALCEAALA
jgi:DNA (cytosine-5)-methyltransferase 1